jgi:hypothetical protein
MCTRLGDTVSWESSTSYEEWNGCELNEKDLGEQHSLWRVEETDNFSGAR